MQNQPTNQPKQQKNLIEKQTQIKLTEHKKTKSKKGQTK